MKETDPQAYYEYLRELCEYCFNIMADSLYSRLVASTVELYNIITDGNEDKGSISVCIVGSDGSAAFGKSDNTKEQPKNRQKGLRQHQLIQKGGERRNIQEHILILMQRRCLRKLLPWKGRN